MKTIDTFQITFPKTMDELAALDATRETPFLKALCNRRGIYFPNPNPTAADAIPCVERALANHDKHPARTCGPWSGDYTEWKQTHDDLAEFIAQLSALQAAKVGRDVPACTASAAPRAHDECSIDNVLPNAPTSSSLPTHTHDAPAPTDNLQTQCDQLGIPLPNPNPTPAETLRAAEQQMTQHRRRAIVDFPGGEEQWRKTYDNLQNFIRQLHARIATETKTGTHPVPDPGTQTGTEAVQTDSTHEKPNPSKKHQTPRSKPHSGPSEISDLEAEILSRNPLLAKAKKYLTDFDPAHNRSAGATESTDSTNSNSVLSPEPSVLPLSALCQDISDELQKTTSPLDDLDPQRQQTLFELLDNNPYRTVQKVLALPAPQGWGIKTSISSLTRFYKRYEKRQTHQQHKEAALLAKEILADPAATDTELFNAATRLAAIRLLQAANDPATKVRDLKDLFQIQFRSKSLTLAQQRLKTKQHESDDNQPTPSEVGRDVPSAPRAHEATPTNPTPSNVQTNPAKGSHPSLSNSVLSVSSESSVLIPNQSSNLALEPDALGLCAAFNLHQPGVPTAIDFQLPTADPFRTLRPCPGAY